MKNPSLCFLLFCCSLAVLVSSCAGLHIEKRKYAGGFSVQWKNKMVAEEDNENSSDKCYVNSTVVSERKDVQFNGIDHAKEEVKDELSIHRISENTDVVEALNDLNFVDNSSIVKIEESRVVSDIAIINDEKGTEEYYLKRSKFFGRIMLIAILSSYVLTSLLSLVFPAIGGVILYFSYLIFLIAAIARIICRKRYREKLIERLKDNPDDPILKEKVLKEKRRKRLLVVLLIVLLFFSLLSIAALSTLKF